jgi:signal transduction histidine kinase/tetratricopeptide (TPR) repeat protein
MVLWGAAPKRGPMKIKLNWQKRAIIILAGSLVLLSIVLAIFAIRDAKRERLLTESAIEEEQRRCAEAVGSQVETTLSDAEERVGKLLQRYPQNLIEERFAEMAKEIGESEELIQATFLINSTGRITFAGAKPLFMLPGEGKRLREASGEMRNSELRTRAENAEFRHQNYRDAIASYEELMTKTSDPGLRAFLLARIGRCHLKAKNFQKGAEAYNKVLEICPRDVTAEDIPLGVIAWSQLRTLYLTNGNKEKASGSLLSFLRDLLDSKWPLTKSQFTFYTKDTKTRIKALFEELDVTGKGDQIRYQLDELDRLEKERLKLTRILETVNVRIIPRFDVKNTETGNQSDKFFRVSESSDDALVLVSIVRLDEQHAFGVILNPGILAQKLVPPDRKAFRMREGWYLQVTDQSGNVVAGQDVASMKPSTPQQTFTGTFTGSFPPWKINIYQTDLDAPKTQYRLRMIIYISSVLTVIAALFLGGFMAIKGTAKELRLAALKTDFAATVSHEFRTPLMSIRYLAELLQRGRVPDDSRKQQYYETITNESERLSRLVENILDFSKIETGVKEYRMEATDIAAVAANVAARFRQQAGLKSFNMETEIAEDMPKIIADKDAVSRALFNLLDNAVKYSGDSPQVWLRGWYDPNQIFFEVADNGIGISRSEQQKIFQKFYRSEQALAGNARGSGIGLTLVDHIVKAHGGRVLLESEPGRGTTVRIQLPRRQPEHDEGDKNG